MAPSDHEAAAHEASDHEAADHEASDHEAAAHEALLATIEAQLAASNTLPLPLEAETTN